MSSDEGGSPGPEEMYSLEQVLDRFIAEVNHVSRDGQANYRRLESQLRAQFASIRRDLSRQVGREFASLRSELSGVGNPGPSSCCSEHTKDNVGAGRFPLFHRLPPEIRARIWTMALPERVVELRATYMHRPPPLMPAQRLHPPLLPPAMSIVAAASMAGGAGTGLEFGGGNPPITLPPPPPPISNSNGPVITTNRLPPPAIAHVCHEARTIALSHGSLRRTKAIEDGSGMGMLNPWGVGSRASGVGVGVGVVVGCTPPPLPSGGVFQSSLHTTAWTWFSPARDWLKIPAMGLLARGADISNGPLERLQAEAQNVLLRRPGSAAELERQLERIVLGQCPAMRTLGVVVSYEMVRPRRSMVAETRLFGVDPFRFVDLRNAQEVAHIAAIFRADLNSNPPPTDPADTRNAEAWEDHAAALRLLADTTTNSTDDNNNSTNRRQTTRLCNWTSHRDDELKTTYILVKHRRSPTTVPLSAIIQVVDDDDENDTDMQQVLRRPYHPWVRAELRAMPDIKLLHMFILDDMEGRDLKRLYGSSFQWRLNSVAVM